MSKSTRIMMIAAAAGIASVATAGTWDEIDSGGFQTGELFPGFNIDNFDAGKKLSNANQTFGFNSLDTITNQLSFGYDVDMFCITITDAANFSATGSANWDYSLALFAEDGTAVAYNGANADPGIQAQIDSTLVAPLGEGVYYLAVIDNNMDTVVNALNAAGDDIFDLTDLSLQNAPTAADPVLGMQDDQDKPGPWGHTLAMGPSSTAFGSTLIDITLTGAGYHVPAPGALAALGLGGLAVARRRR